MYHIIIAGVVITIINQHVCRYAISARRRKRNKLHIIYETGYDVGNGTNGLGEVVYNIIIIIVGTRRTYNISRVECEVIY